MTIIAGTIKRIRGNGTTYTVEAIKIHENYTDVCFLCNIYIKLET